MELKRFVTISFAIILLSACSGSGLSFGSFALVSDQADNLSRHYVSVGKPVENKDCHAVGPLFLFAWGTPIDETASLAKILKENDADALLYAEFKHSSLIIPYIYARSCLTVTGTPVKLKGNI